MIRRLCRQEGLDRCVPVRRKVRVFRRYGGLELARLQPVVAPCPCNHHENAMQIPGRAALSQAVHPARRCAVYRLQNPGLQRLHRHRGDLSGIPAAGLCDPLFGNSIARTRLNAVIEVEPLRHLISRMAGRHQEDQPDTSGIFRPIRPASGLTCQRYAPRIWQRRRVRHGHGHFPDLIVAAH